MDFVDEFDTVGNAATYKINLSQDEVSDGEEQFNFSNNSLFKPANGPDMSILDKVKKRLYGDTQPINQEETESTSTQLINDTQPIQRQSTSTPSAVSLAEFATEFPSVESPTQTAESPIPSADVYKSLPQLPVDDSLFKPKPSIDNLFVDLEDEQPYHQLTTQQRDEKIKKLAEEKRLKRIQQEENGSLTDEELELNEEAYDKSVDSSRVEHQQTRKELEEIDKFININKRNQVIQPEFTNKKTFTKQNFLEAFLSDDESDSNKHISSMDREDFKSSPTTSPLKNVSKPGKFEDELIPIAKPKPKSRSNKNPIEMYAENLKRQLLSSPTKQNEEESATAPKMIDLDESDLDSDYLSKNASSPIPMMNSTFNTNLNRNHGYSTQAKYSTKQQLADLTNIPDLSKEMNLVLKQKFLKKKLSNSSKPELSLPNNLRNLINSNSSIANNKKVHNKFINNLKKANIHQLQEWQKMNPHKALELAVNEEMKGDSLFQREIERVREIRRKEKRLEKAKKALLSKNDSEGEGEGEDNEDVPDSDFDDIPDSEFDDEEAESSEGSGAEDNESGEEDQIPARRNKKLVISDDDEEGEAGSEEREKPASDDSYMFGGHSSNKNSQENTDLIINHGLSDSPKIGIMNNEVSTQKVSNDFGESMYTNTQESGSRVLFSNLEPRAKPLDDMDEEELEFDDSNRSLLPIELPSFSETIQTQHDTLQHTQADSVLPTQMDDSTQRINLSMKESTQLDDEEDEDIAGIIKRGRAIIKQNALGSIVEEKEEAMTKLDESEVEEETPEQIKVRIKMYENKIRRKELKERKRRKEFEKKGLKNILEGEAQESEDEWKGIGGLDYDLSDQADSEDEKMIDNDFNIDLNDEEIRKKFMEQYQIKDRKELEKLIDDIKNHKLSKRIANKNSLDIELSDEEDELLLAWKRQIVKEQKSRLAQNKKLRKIAKNEKAKAFLDLVQDDYKPTIVLDDEASDSDENESKSQSPFVDSNNATDKDEDENEEEDKIKIPTRKRPTLKLKESFVKKSLSFLDRDNDDNNYHKNQMMSRLQHDFESSDDEVEDISSLKKKCLSNLQSRSVSVIETDGDQNKRSFAESQVTDFDELDDEDDDELLRILKKPSCIQSFKLLNGEQSITSSFSGVTVSKQYKVASGSKASITYMSKNPQVKSIKSAKAKEIELKLQEIKANSMIKGMLKSNNSKKH